MPTRISDQARFGNFIGEEAETEAASDAGVDAGDYAFDDEDGEDGADTGIHDELMEVDGQLLAQPHGPG